jgi:hypothetical protein
METEKRKEEKISRSHTSEKNTIIKLFKNAATNDPSKLIIQ